MGKELLLEIGAEEIPAAFLPPAMKDMEALIGKEFAEQMISHGEIKTMAAPRRLVISVADVANKQADRVLEKLGPSKKAAFDRKGEPTPAATGFAGSQGVDIEALETINTDRGEYLVARKKIAGREVRSLLPEILPKLITALSFRKSMRWADFELRFARPIHWILAVFDGETVPFKLENIESGNMSRGHRFLKPEPFTAKNLEEYLGRSRESFVIADPSERREMILEGAKKAARSLKGTAYYNEELLENVTYIVEYPCIIAGSFDAGYLNLPKEVLATSMMTQQKYFPVADDKGNLLNHFLTISNTVPRDPDVVKRGNEKVIRARLSDAKFFFEEDRKRPLETRVPDLKGVVFHTLLGTSHDKVMRTRTLAVELASVIAPHLKERVFRTATLAKADLTTQMVGEFPELQGIMGREYAFLEGEDPVVAKAIYEHYLPTSAGGALPETAEGALVSIADKTDSIAGFFGVGLMPTGAADPYALRRQAIGVINIILAKEYTLPIDDLIDRSLAVLDGVLKRPAADVKGDILAFFRSRFANQLISQGRAYDVVDAVLSADDRDLVKSLNKINALETVKGDAGFEPLAAAFKRIANIIKDFKGGPVDTSLFESEAENNLYRAHIEIGEKTTALIKSGDYLSCLREMANLRRPVDDFFDSVLVMSEKDAVRFNRLSLLWALSSRFREIADFSKIVTSP